MTQPASAVSQFFLEGTGEGAAPLSPVEAAVERAPVIGAEHQRFRPESQRFELKYWLTERQAERVSEFVAPYLEHDPNGLTRAAERNTTLYLDTRGFRFCESHLLLSPDRAKLRIRAYGLPLGEVAFFEIKRKVKTVTMKDRCALPMAEVGRVLGRRSLARAISGEALRTLDAFRFQMSLHRAEPKLYVACFREAFQSRVPGEDVRLTIDRQLVYQPATGLEFSPSERHWVDIREGDDARPAFGQRRALLELKFAHAAPRWMSELVRYFELRREAFSKYTSAALQLRGRR